MRHKHAKYLAVLAGVLILCAACRRPAALYDSSQENTAVQDGESTGAKAETGENGTEEAEASEAEQEKICVYVCGQVNQPGVYELPADARITDAVEAAGGMTGEAAGTYLNLAEHLTDGQKIEVPTQEEALQMEELSRELESALVNLNTASAEELMTLTGIGEAKAKDILDYRETHGGFGSIEELMNISGIKEGVFQKIKDQITV